MIKYETKIKNQSFLSFFLIIIAVFEIKSKQNKIVNTIINRMAGPEPFVIISFKIQIFLLLKG